MSSCTPSSPSSSRPTTNACASIRSNAACSPCCCRVAAAGDGDAGETATSADGRVHRRLPAPHSRTYRSIFGTLSIPRFVYGSREGQAITHVPLDATLGLPAGEFSYVLEDWCQRLCVQDAFRESVRSLHDLLGLRPSVRSLEQMNQILGEVAGDFAWQQSAPPPKE